MIGLILEKSLQHLIVSMTALLLALAITLPLSFYLSQKKGARSTLLIVRAISLIQTMPGLAVIAMIVVLLVAVRKIIPVPTTGFLPGVIALSLYGISPILTSAYTGLTETDPTMVEVATGLGMTKKQTLFLVQAPQAIPMIMTGVRIAGVWTIGMCTLASMVGCGGLGDLILQGLRSLNATYILAGTIPSAILAVFFELGMTRMEKWLRVEE